MLLLLLWRNWVLKKRHWFLTIVELLIPISLFLAVAYGRTNLQSLTKKFINDVTIHEKITEDDLYSQLDNNIMNLWYTPATTNNNLTIATVQQQFQIEDSAIRSFGTKEDLLESFNKENPSLLAVIVFHENSNYALNYDLTIYEKYFTWDTEQLYSEESVSGNTTSPKYVQKGYAALQLAIDKAFIERKGYSFSFTLQRFPDPPRTVDNGIEKMFKQYLPLITIFSFICLCFSVLQKVGEEKASGIKEYMKMVGVKSSLIWFSWLFSALLTYIPSMAATIVLMKVPFWATYPMIEHADGTVLFLFLFLYCMATITFCFFIGTVFKKPCIATTFGVFIWIISYFIPQQYLSHNENLSWFLKIALALCPNVALYEGFSVLSVFEIREVGVQWRNVMESETGDKNDVTMFHVFLILITDTILFMILSIYIENIRPGKYGISKPLIYPLLSIKKVLRCFIKPRYTKIPENEKNDEVFIKIQNLCKRYGNHAAVDKLNMKILKNQVTVMLGENGAGKTTTMSMLTGMIDATSGNIFVNHFDLNKNTEKVRKLMGLCTQHNLLFPDLTVLEHLIFFGKLKDSKCVEKEAEKLLEELHLEDKKNKLVEALSGGMQRKLCLGIALIGNSEILVLDEPTAAIDIESRREIWNLLLKYKEKKTILISTHFMEEADALGDQIAIMANGKLQCYDTPGNLKTKYNTGYRLSLLTHEAFNKYKIIKEMKKKNCKLIDKKQDSLIYLLPFAQTINEKSDYIEIVQFLENWKQEFGISGIFLNETTLTDVFFKARNDLIEQERKQTTLNIEDAKNKLEEFKPEITKFPGKQLYNCFILLVKRYYFLKKQFFWLFAVDLVAIFIILLALWLPILSTSDRSKEPTIQYNLQTYGRPKIYYSESNSGSIVNSDDIFYDQLITEQDAHSQKALNVTEEIIKEGVKNIVFYTRHMVTATEFDHTDDQLRVNAMYSHQSVHGIPIAINLATNAILRNLTDANFSIVTSNTPLQDPSVGFSPSELNTSDVTILWLILFTLGMLLYSASFIAFLTAEIGTNFLHIQAIAGVNMFLYRCTNMFFDCIFSIFPLAIFVWFLLLLNTIYGTFFSLQEILAIITITICYGIFSQPYIYLLGSRKTVARGLSILFIMTIFIGIMPALPFITTELPNNNSNENLKYYIKQIFSCFSPQFSFSYNIVKLSKKYVENFNWKFMDPHKRNYICQVQPNPCCIHGTNSSECQNYQSYFYNDKLGLLEQLPFFICSYLLYMVILILCKTETLPNGEFTSHFMKRLKLFFSYSKKSSDAKDSLLFKVDKLTMSLGNDKVLKKVDLKVKKNTCFGLLGTNGAGKSTAFGIFSKLLLYNGGNVQLNVNKKTIPISDDEYYKNIGYCPQANYLNFLLTGREIVFSLACLRGYSWNDAKKLTTDLLFNFDLLKVADKPCCQYSGGNKRRLSTCLAFLGAPKFIMLDEPTNGVDPSNRRQIWNWIEASKKDTTLLLSSHSMEECETICDDIGILNQGKMERDGSLLDLKKNISNQHKIALKLSPYNSIDTLLKDEITTEMKATNFKENKSYISWNVCNEDVPLSKILQSLEKLQTKYQEYFIDYTINHASLEDIFLDVIHNNQKTEKTKSPTVGLCCCYNKQNKAV